MIMLRQHDRLTPVLAIAGTVLLWLPILAPILFMLRPLISAGVVHFDYLMPAELFLVALVGGGLALWASVRARSRTTILGWTMGIAFVALAGGQLWALASGLATGATPAAGWQWWLALASIAVYAVGVLFAAVLGTMLVVELLRRSRRPTP